MGRKKELKKAEKKAKANIDTGTIRTASGRTVAKLEGIGPSGKKAKEWKKAEPVADEAHPAEMMFFAGALWNSHSLALNGGYGPDEERFTAEEAAKVAARVIDEEPLAADAMLRILRDYREAGYARPRPKVEAPKVSDALRDAMEDAAAYVPDAGPGMVTLRNLRNAVIEAFPGVLFAVADGEPKVD